MPKGAGVFFWWPVVASAALGARAAPCVSAAMKTRTVKTSGPFFLFDRLSGAEIDHNEVDVPFTSFIAERIANGDLIDLSIDLDGDGELPAETLIADNDDDPVLEEPALEEPALEEPVVEEPALEADANKDGHDDKSGEFVPHNNAATGRRGKRGR